MESTQIAVLPRWSILLLMVVLMLAFMLVVVPDIYAGGGDESDDDDDDEDEEEDDNTGTGGISYVNCYYNGEYIGRFYHNAACEAEKEERARQEAWEAANPVCSVTGTRMSTSSCSNLVVCDVATGTLAGAVTTISACNNAKEYLEFRESLSQTDCESQVENTGTCLGSAAPRPGSTSPTNNPQAPGGPLNRGG